MGGSFWGKDFVLGTQFEVSGIQKVEGSMLWGGVSNLWPVGRMLLRMAMNTAIINLLKT